MYTGVGALNWPPDIDQWAGVVAGFLRPGGRLHLREGHPVLCSLDDPRKDHLVAIEYPYFETAEPTGDEPSTYASAGEEHDCVPYRALGDQMEPHPDHPGEFRLADRPERLPTSYTLRAVTNG